MPNPVIIKVLNDKKEIVKSLDSTNCTPSLHLKMIAFQNAVASIKATLPVSVSNFPNTLKHLTATGLLTFDQTLDTGEHYEVECTRQDLVDLQDLFKRIVVRNKPIVGRGETNNTDKTGENEA